MDFENACLVRHELGLDELDVVLPLNFIDPAFSRKVQARSLVDSAHVHITGAKCTLAASFSPRTIAAASCIETISSRPTSRSSVTILLPVSSPPLKRLPLSAVPY